MTESVRVLEFSDELGGIAGEFLATSGAAVTRVLLPGQAADPVRDADKRILEWDAFDLARDAASAELVIDGLGWEGLERHGLAPERWAQAHPAVVLTRISWFGHAGPDASAPGSDLVAQATGGTLYLNGPLDRPPVQEPCDAARFHAELTAVAGALAAVRAARRDGIGDVVDVSVQEAAASRLHRVQYQFDGRIDRRGAMQGSVWRLADGWASLALSPGTLGAPGVAAIVEWMREAGHDPGDLAVEAARWTEIQAAELRGGLAERLRPGIAAFFETRTKAEFRERTLTRGVQGAVIATPQDVLEDDHLAARGFWATADDGTRRPGRYAGVSVAGRVDPTPVAPGDTPLAGVRVLDLCWAIAGSQTTVQLAQLGADVVRIETRARADLARTEVQASVSSRESLDDKPWAANLNISKRSMRLNMRAPESRAVFEELVRWADVLTENFRPGTLDRLGWTAEELRRINPRLVIARGSMAGQSGPLSGLWGIDTTGRALAGRSYLTGWPDAAPVSGIGTAAPYGDLTIPYAKAAAIIDALLRRERTGEVLDIDVSMIEVLVQQIAGAVRAAQQGDPPERTGNRAPGFAPQGVYPVAGDDRWVAISVRGDEEWRALAECAAADGVVLDPDADAAARRARADELDEAIAGWTRPQDGPELVVRLRAAGIRAGVVQDVAEVSDRDPQLAARGFLEVLDHPVLGPFPHSTLPYTFARARLVRRPAPRFGEHTREIATSVCALGDADYAALDAAGVFD